MMDILLFFWFHIVLFLVSVFLGYLIVWKYGKQKDIVGIGLILMLSIIIFGFLWACIHFSFLIFIR